MKIFEESLSFIETSDVHMMRTFGLKFLGFIPAVIMTPTRELALQITKECKKFSKTLGVRVVCVYGGTGISEQVCYQTYITLIESRIAKTLDSVSKKCFGACITSAAPISNSHIFSQDEQKGSHLNLGK